MKTRGINRAFVISAIISIILSGCGGGSSNSDNNATTEANSSVDAPELVKSEKDFLVASLEKVKISNATIEAKENNSEIVAIVSYNGFDIPITLDNNDIEATEQQLLETEGLKKLAFGINFSTEEVKNNLTTLDAFVETEIAKVLRDSDTYFSKEPFSIVLAEDNTTLKATIPHLTTLSGEAYKGEGTCTVYPVDYNSSSDYITTLNYTVTEADEGTILVEFSTALLTAESENFIRCIDEAQASEVLEENSTTSNYMDEKFVAPLTFDNLSVAEVLDGERHRIGTPFDISSVLNKFNTYAKWQKESEIKSNEKRETFTQKVTIVQNAIETLQDVEQATEQVRKLKILKEKLVYLSTSYVMDIMGRDSKTGSTSYTPKSSRNVLIIEVFLQESIYWTNKIKEAADYVQEINKLSLSKTDDSTALVGSIVSDENMLDYVEYRCIGYR